MLEEYVLPTLQVSRQVKVIHHSTLCLAGKASLPIDLMYGDSSRECEDGSRLCVQLETVISGSICNCQRNFEYETT